MSARDPEIHAILRHALNERVAELLYVRFLVDLEDGRKAADMIVDMILKRTGRGNAAGL